MMTFANSLDKGERVASLGHHYACELDLLPLMTSMALMGLSSTPFLLVSLCFL